MAREAGFSLVEMLVAMLLLSLVGITLARFQTFQLQGTARLAMAAGAGIEADNLAVDLLSATDAPTRAFAGTRRNGGRDWHFAVAPGPSPDPALLPEMVSIVIEVAAREGGPALAVRRLMRPKTGAAPKPGARP
jgi:prepilin-type N-terminal cleavage/methylation domain-containing protein